MAGSHDDFGTVEAYRPNGDYVPALLHLSGTTYWLSGLPVGTYYLSASFMATSHLVSGLYYPGATAAPSTPIVITAGATVTLDIDAPVGGTIAGRVTVPSGYTGDLQASAIERGGSRQSWADVTADGTYELLGLSTGSYDVIVSPLYNHVLDYGYYHPGAVSSHEPTPVSVVAGQTTSGIDIALGYTSEPVAGFADVDASAPFASDIGWLAAQGITTGSVRPDGSVVFDPTGPVRREAMAAFLYRAAGRPDFTAPAVSPFVDVATDAPFYREISWLAEQGITTGTDVGGGRREFRPAESVTREAMAAFLYRAARSPEFTAPAVAPFSDLTATSPFSKEITWLASVGISTGTDIGDGKREYRPAEPVRREAMAAFLHRAANLHTPS
jgi:hypothetical protein